jgi:hypothetical protein
MMSFIVKLLEGRFQFRAANKRNRLAVAAIRNGHEFPFVSGVQVFVTASAARSRKVGAPLHCGTTQKA